MNRFKLRPVLWSNESDSKTIVAYIASELFMLVLNRHITYICSTVGVTN